MDAREVDEWCCHVYNIGKDVADALSVGQLNRALGPTVTFPFIQNIPVSLERGTAKECQDGGQEVERCHHEDGQPNDGLIDSRKVEYEEPGADGPF